MARYIDADKFIEWLDVSHFRSPYEVCCSENDIKIMIDIQPSADVAPKSEYDAVVNAVDNSTKEFLTLYDKYQEQKETIGFLRKTIADNAQRSLEVTLEEVEKAKTEVAREIIGIIEQRIELNNNRACGVHNEMVLSVYRGRNDGYRDIKEIIEQKYTEGET